MTEMDKMLADACDDTGQPLRRSIDEVIRRGRRRVRIRRTGSAAGMLAAGALVAGVAMWPSTESGTGPDGAPFVGSPSYPTPSRPTTQPRAVVPPPPVATLSDARVIQRCSTLDREFTRVSSNKAGGGTESIDDWTVVLKQAPRHWVQAILLSPDHKRWAYCRFDTRGSYRQDYFREAVAVSGRDYQVHSADDGSQGPLPSKVVRLTFETADGVVSEARIAGGFYLWFNGRPYTDKPIWATFYDAAGKQLARFNANPKPKTCATVTKATNPPRVNISC